MAIDTILFGRNGLVGSEVFKKLTEKFENLEAPSSKIVDLADTESVAQYFKSIDFETHLNLFKVLCQKKLFIYDTRKQERSCWTGHDWC